MNHKGIAHKIIAIAALLFCLFCLGCTETIYHGLSEREANEMVVVLEQHAIEAHKGRDSSGDDVWVVSVATGARVEAWRVLEIEGLPRPAAGGFGEFYPSGGLIPTSGEERILLQYATAREIQTSLLKIEGVVDAHVNLVMPAKPRVQLSTETVEPPRASVLLKYRAREGMPLPIEEEALRGLVAGGVEGLSGENIEVIMIPAMRSIQPLGKSQMGQVGPISVAEGSKTFLQVLIGLMGAVIMALAGGLAFLITRKKS
ncbi:MAG: hypothetical protein ACNA8W_20975 [Bradymonadaceae bacterium]